MSAEAVPLLAGQRSRSASDSAAGMRRAAAALGDGSSCSRRPVPQNIGHRGYNAAFPENTMVGFQGAVQVGADAIETDLHLSRDGVVVLSHDPTLKRCFGKDEKIADCDWDYLSGLKTLREPHVGMPRLVDLLKWMTEPGIESIWLLLDIKTDDDPDALLSAIADTIASVPPPPSRPWRERIVLGGWNEHYLAASRAHLPGYPLAYIGFSPLYARKFLPPPSGTYPHDDVDFNLLQAALVGPVGACFRRAVAKAGRRLYVWTVNEEAWMEWSVRKAVDGVVTDDPRLMREVCDRMVGGGGGGRRIVVEDGGKKLDKMATRRRSWLGYLSLYARAMVAQAVSVVLIALLWRRLNTKGAKPKVVRENPPVSIPVKV
ncbi:PLC-like phosphodiesterase [Canariomyces notabilis]|uniref:PLC-like phosphodiesterase n=1 Tax=Canariomyces notabilis TaxID=2074819 RepID=A0AAN6TGC2_9PEZI|nr:PLC-like phosphodiesterase [Canariomyces arenarius]